MLGEKVATVHSWKARRGGANTAHSIRCSSPLPPAIASSSRRKHKEGKDFKEIDLLARQSERHARIGKFNNGGNEADLNPNVQKPQPRPRKQPEKTSSADEQIEKLEEFSTTECLIISATGGKQENNRIRNA